MPQVVASTTAEPLFLLPTQYTLRSQTLNPKALEPQNPEPRTRIFLYLYYIYTHTLRTHLCNMYNAYNMYMSRDKVCCSASV